MNTIIIIICQLVLSWYYMSFFVSEQINNLIITFIALQKKSPSLVTAESYGKRLAEMGDQFDDMNAKELTDMAQHASATNSEGAFRFFRSVVRNVFELGRNRLRKSCAHTCTSIMLC